MQNPKIIKEPKSKKEIMRDYRAKQKEKLKKEKKAQLEQEQTCPSIPKDEELDEVPWLK